MRKINKIVKMSIYILIISILVVSVSCTSSRRRNTREKPDRRKIKPCDCPKFGHNLVFDVKTNWLT